MPGYVSHNSYDCFSSNIVSVIASFDTDGHIRPLYVRINEDALKVYSSWLKPSFSGVMKFNCKVIDQGCLKPLLLTYHKAEGIWTIPKSGVVT